MYYLGVDGGGSKTAFLITDEAGRIVTEGLAGGCAYPQVGIEGAAKVIGDKLEALLKDSRISRAEIGAAALGLPCYGENPKQDHRLEKAVRRAVGVEETAFYNDVELGWAGSLGMSPGVHVVAGTGAIAYGRDSAGKSARSNGWHEDFSDEGSGYWLGLQALSAFAKQADGREERTELFEAMKQALGLSGAEELVAVYNEKYRGNRRGIAHLQETLLTCARQNEPTALALYQKAAKELAKSAAAVAGHLDFPPGEEIPVSYSGGVFRAGTVICKPFEENLRKWGLKLHQPLFDPVCGGILLAAARRDPEHLEEMKSAMTERQMKEGKQKGEARCF